MSEDIMLMEMSGAFERGQQHGLTRPDVDPRVGNAQNNVRRQHSMPLGVMLTGYRLLTTIVIVGIGIPKAMYSYNGQSLISPSLDWVGGIVFALLLFWLGIIEATRPELCPKFFDVDLAPALLRLLGRDITPSALDPATLESPHRDDISLHFVPVRIPGPRVRSRGDTSSPSAPEILTALHHGYSPPPPPVPFISNQPPQPPPTFPVPYIFANTRPATPATLALPMLPTVQPARIPNHQIIAPTKPGYDPFAIRRGPPLSHRGHRHDVNEREEPEIDLTDLRAAQFDSRPGVASRTTGLTNGPFAMRARRRLPTKPKAQESASKASSNLSEVIPKREGRWWSSLAPAPGRYSYDLGYLRYLTRESDQATKPTRTTWAGEGARDTNMKF